MLFFPYKLDISLFRIPLLTIAVCLICLAVFLSQVSSAHKLGNNLQNYCSNGLDPNLHAMLDAIHDAEFGSGCASVFSTLREQHDRDAAIARLAREVRGLDFYRDQRQDLEYKEGALRAGLSDFETLVPKELTDRLAYRPDRYDPVTMITSTFAHASPGHLLGNLLFFYIFASCVECALGALHFAAAFLLMAVVTSVAYSHSVGAEEALPAVGLSGVAMGMMAMMTTMLPRARIWCLFWFFFFFRRFTLPILLFAAWQVGWNIYELMQHDPASNINYVAHVSGAVTGIVLGVLYRTLAPQRLDVLEEGMGA